MSESSILNDLAKIGLYLQSEPQIDKTDSSSKDTSTVSSTIEQSRPNIHAPTADTSTTASTSLNARSASKDLGEKIDTLETKIANLDVESKTIKTFVINNLCSGEICAINKKIKGLDEDVNELKNEASKLKDEVKNLKNKFEEMENIASARQAIVESLVNILSEACKKIKALEASQQEANHKEATIGLALATTNNDNSISTNGDNTNIDDQVSTEANVVKEENKNEPHTKLDKELNGTTTDKKDENGNDKNVIAGYEISSNTKTSDW